MMKYHVEKCNLTVTIMDGKLDDIEKGNTDPLAITVDSFDATFDAIHVRHGKLHLDWLAFTDLAAWLFHEFPDAPWRGYMKRLLQMFPGSSDISDLMRATMRCLSNNEHLAHGEDSYFCKRVRSTHRDEFEEIRAGFERRYGNLDTRLNVQNTQRG